MIGLIFGLVLASAFISLAVCIIRYLICFGAETLLGVAASFWMINLSCYYLNKKTNSIWTGTITASVIMTWLCIFATGMNF